MFRHILLPTDGSVLAAKSVAAGIALAKETGARVTGYFALESIPVSYYGEMYALNESDIESMERRDRDIAESHLARMKKEAEAAGVEFSSVISTVPSAHIGVIDTARKRKCDVIFMASHGRSGVSRVIMGSVTQKVLTHSKVPVLVYR